MTPIPSHPGREKRPVHPPEPCGKPRPTAVASPLCLPRLGKRPISVLAATLLALATAPGSMEARAQQPGPPGAECPQGRVTAIFIDNHSIFDPASIPEEGHLRWAYRAANRLHVRTRGPFIAQELLFEVGDCYNPLLLQESSRILRGFRFIASADVFSIPQPDGSRHVIVDTRDEWTTKLSIGVQVDEGLRFDGIAMVEENFLGRGAAVGVFHRQRREQRATGALLEIPRVRSSGWDVELAGSRTRAGNSFTQMVEHPFLGEVGTHALRQRVRVSRDLYNWVLPPDGPFTHLVLPVDQGRAELTTARRFGVPGHLLLLGIGVSHEWVRTDPLSSLEGIRDRDFGSTVPVDSALAAPVAGQLTSRETTRLNAMAGIRRIDFVERRGLDALRGVQDVPTGREVVLTVGQSLMGEGDLFGRIDLFGGFAAERTVGQLNASIEGRSVQGTAGGSRDVLTELHAFLYQPLPGSLSQTLVIRGALQGGWRTDGPFQLTLGGPDALRGHREDAWPGGRRILLSVEDRVVLPGPFSHLVDLGFTLFGDVGRMYRGEVPYGTNSGWQGSLGAGLRVGFPAGSAAVIRADLAVPVGRDAPRSPVFRIHAREWLGVLGEFRNPGMERVRRSGVLAEFLGVSRDVRR